jgi:hypothetical protein
MPNDVELAGWSSPARDGGHSETVVLRDCGTQRLWYSETVVLRDGGTQRRWYSETVVLRKKWIPALGRER